MGRPSALLLAERDIGTLVHGSGYVSAGSAGDLDWLETQLVAAYEILTQRLGVQSGWERQGKVLNRVVACDNGGWRSEVEPRHAGLIVEQLGVGDIRAAVTPGVERGRRRRQRGGH